MTEEELNALLDYIDNTIEIALDAHGDDLIDPHWTNRANKQAVINAIVFGEF